MVAMNFDVTATSAAAEASLRDLADEADRFGTALTGLDGKVVKPKVELNIAGARADVETITAALDGIGDRRATVELDGAAAARTQADELAAALDRITNRSASVSLTGAAGARDEAVELADALGRVDDRTATVTLNVTGDTQQLNGLFADAEALQALSPITLDLDVDPNNLGQSRLAALLVQAEALGALSPEIRIELVGDAAMLASLAAIAAQLASLTGGAHDVRIRVAQTSFLAQMAAIRRELNTLAGRKIEITAEIEGLMNQLATARMALASLEAMDPEVRVDADVEAARARVDDLERQLEYIATRPYTAEVKVKVDEDKGAIGRIGKLSGEVVKLGAAGTLAAGGLLQATSAVGGLVVVAGQLVSGLGPIAVGGLLSFAAAQMTVKAGSLGMADAFKAIADQDPEALAEATSKMAPAGKQVALAARDMNSEFGKLRLDVQQKMMDGWGASMRKVGVEVMPTLRQGMGAVSTEVNRGGKDFLAYLQAGEATARLDAIFNNTADAVHNVSPAMTDLTAITLDVGSVGSRVFADMTQGLGITTAKWREMVAQARDSGALYDGIQEALVVVGQLGDVAGNVGGSVKAIWEAGRAEHADFLSRLQQGTQAVETFLQSGAGQNALRALFSETKDTVDALTPGLGTLGNAAGETLVRFGETDGLVRFGQAGSQVADTAARLLPTLGELGGNTLGVLANATDDVATGLGPVASGLSAVLDFLGPIGPGVTAMTLAFVGARVVSGIMATISTSMAAAAVSASNYTLAATGSAAAGVAVANTGAALSTAVSGVAKALPLAAVAVVGLSMAYDAFSTHSDELAKSVADGSLSMSAAIQQAAEQIDANGIDWLGGADEAEAYKLAQADVTAATEAYIGTLPQLEQLQARVNMAQTAHTDAVLKYGPASTEAKDAAILLQEALTNQEGAQQKVKDATVNSTEALLDQQRAQLGAVDADIGYLNSLDRIAEANDRAAEAARNHGAGSREAEAAARAVLTANLDAAAAAGEKARADAVATGAANADEIAARAQKDELIRLAGQASGPTKQALLDAANGTDLLARAQGTAEIQARLQKDELGRLAGQATGPLAGAIANARQNFDTLGGAHASAETRARLQKDELNRLAGMASGPLRTELQRMADQVRTLPDGSFVVTADGKMNAPTWGSGTGKGASTYGLATGGTWLGPGQVQRYAAGGVASVLPGYTPGRDVHRFVSPTGGILDMSGGEGIARPEATRALDRAGGGIYGMNAAARAGGAPAVRKWLAVNGPKIVGGTGGDLGNAYARGGVWGGPRHQRFAMGGVVRLGQPFPAVSNGSYVETRDREAERMRALMAERIKKMMTEAAAGGGPVTAGAASALNWGRTQVGKPYVWGGVGPGGYDCSGFMSALVNVMRGRNPYSRVGSTASFPWPGFQPGGGAGLSIGAFKGSPGHMAGTIGGTNVESSGSVGVRVGGGARGVSASMFNIRAHLADRGGVIPHGDAALNLSGRAERMLTGEQDSNLIRLTHAVEAARTVTASGGAVPPRVSAPAMSAPPVRVDVDMATVVAELRAVAATVRDAAQLAHQDAGRAPAAVLDGMGRVAGALRGTVATEAQQLRSSGELSGRI